MNRRGFFSRLFGAAAATTIATVLPAKDVASDVRAGTFGRFEIVKGVDEDAANHYGIGGNEGYTYSWVMIEARPAERDPSWFSAIDDL